MATFTFQDIFQFADDAMSKYVLDGAMAAADSLKDVSRTMLILYCLMWGWSMMRGLISEPVTDGAARLIRIGIITSLATSSALYASYISNFLYEWPTAFAGILQGGVIHDSAQLLDQMLDKGNLLGGQTWEKASALNLGNYLLAIVIFFLTWITTAISAVLIISSKLGLALLLAIGPVFILMFLFEATRKFFDLWLGSVVTAGLAIVLVTMATALVFKIMDATYDAVQLQTDINSGVASMKEISVLVIYGIIGTFFILGAPSLAQGIGGGVSSGSAAAGGWAYDKIKDATKRKPKKKDDNNDEKNKNKNNSNGSSGGSVKDSSSSKPAAIYRKITTRRNK